jgi:hypothetical protein
LLLLLRLLCPLVLLPLALAPAPPAGAADAPVPSPTGMVRITAPVAEAALTGSLTIAVQAFDQTGVRSITLYADGIRINTFTCAGPTCAGAFVWVTDSLLPPGAHTLLAVATSTGGVSMQSLPVTVLKPAAPPPRTAFD